MTADVFTVLAEPARRRILDVLRITDSSVGDLAGALSLTQPAVSKHLKVLRDNGFVSVRIAAQRRIYRIEPERLRDVDDWLLPYRELWIRHSSSGTDGYADRLGVNRP